MDCENAHDLITRSISGNASAQNDAELKRHLESCPTCSEMRRRLGKVWDLMGRAPRVALTEEQTKAVSSRVRRNGSTGAPVRVKPVLTEHRRWAAVGLAAALLVAIAVYFALPESQVPNVPVNTVDGVPPKEEVVADNPLEIPPVPHETTTTEMFLRQYDEETPKTPEVPVPAPLKDKPLKTNVQVADAPKPETPKVEEKPESNPAQTAKAPKKPETVTPPQDPPKRETQPVVAALVRAEGNVFVLRDGREVPAKAGQKLMSGHGLGTRGLESQAVVEFPDRTRLVMGADTTLDTLSDRGPAAKGKRVFLARGVLACDVVRQLKGENMIFLTPHAEARVLGTRLTLTVKSSTLLEVHKGRVRLERKIDGKAVEVSTGRFAVAGKGITLAARKITRARVALRDPFAGTRWSQMWAQRLESGLSPRFKVEKGYLSLPFPEVGPDDVSPSGLAPTPGAPLPADVGRKALDTVLSGTGIGSRTEWPRATWLDTRKAFPLVKDAPLRIRAKVWQSHSDDKRTAWICLNRRTAKDHLVLERRGDVLQLWAGNKKTSLWKAGRPSVGKFETLEIWLTRTQVIIRRNDETLHVGPNPSRSRAVLISLGGGAKTELAQDEEVRFDDVDVAWMSQADLTRILK